MTTQPSDADLATGRRLVRDLDQSQWELGDLAVKVAGAATRRGQHDPNRAALDSFAEAIGIAPARLAEYRAVASAWPPDTRLEGAAWILHRGLVGRDDRAAHLEAFLEACKAEGVPPTRERLRRFPHRDRPDEGTEGRKVPTTVRIPDTIEEVDQRLEELGRTWEDNAREYGRIVAEMEDAIVEVVLAVGLDPLDAEAVMAWLAEPKPGGTTIDLNDLWRWNLVAGPEDPDDPAEVWETLYDHYERRQHPVDSDPWEDRR